MKPIYLSTEQNDLLINVLMYQIVLCLQQQKALSGRKRIQVLVPEYGDERASSDSALLFALEAIHLHDGQKKVQRSKTILTKLYLEEFGYYNLTQEELDELYDAQAHFHYDCGGELLCNENIAGFWHLVPLQKDSLVSVKPACSIEARLFILAAIESGLDKRIDFTCLKHALETKDTALDYYLWQYTSIGKQYTANGKWRGDC